MGGWGNLGEPPGSPCTCVCAVLGVTERELRNPASDLSGVAAQPGSVLHLLLLPLLRALRPAPCNPSLFLTALPLTLKQQKGTSAFGPGGTQKEPSLGSTVASTSLLRAGLGPTDQPVFYWGEGWRVWRVCALSVAGSPHSAPRFQSYPTLILERKGRELFYPTFASSLPTPHQAEIRVLSPV